MRSGSELLEQARDYGTTAAEYGSSALHAVQDPVSKVSTEALVVGAFASIGISLTLKLLGRDRDAEFVGHWVPTFLTLALLTKLQDHSQKTETALSRRGGGRRGSTSA